MKHFAYRYLLFVCAVCMICPLSVFSQTMQDTARGKKVVREDIGIVKKLTVMPYATISYNLQSGQAFPKSAQGIGYGFGIAFDFTEDRQPLGAYFDFAYQDMRASAKDGGCGQINANDPVFASVPVTNYFSYALFEGFLKLQSEKTNGYFLIGASIGLVTTSLTARDSVIPSQQYSDWNSAVDPTTGKTIGNKFRVDIRAGIGLKLGYISGHQLVVEARFGYPVTNVIDQYTDQCNGSGTGGSWRVVTMQINAGLRL